MTLANQIDQVQVSPNSRAALIDPNLRRITRRVAISVTPVTGPSDREVLPAWTSRVVPDPATRGT